jgi:multiple sugar transport system permease protein
MRSNLLRVGYECRAEHTHLVIRYALNLRAAFRNPAYERTIAMRMRRSTRQGLAGILLIMPALLLILGMMLYPTIWSVNLSLSQNNSILSGNYSYVGTGNYVKVLESSQFWTALVNTVIFVCVTVLLELVLGLVLSVQLNKPLPGVNVFRGLTATPMMVAAIASGLIWKLIFYDNNGVMNWFLNQIGLENVNWFSSMIAARFAVLIASLWGSLPFAVLVLLAALQGIPEEYNEAALIDGAGGWQRFRYITLPLLRDTILVILIIRISDAYKIYDIIVSLTNAGPANATNSISFFIYRKTYFDFKFGEGTAASFILLGVIVVSCLLVLIPLNLSRREKTYGMG